MYRILKVLLTPILTFLLLVLIFSFIALYFKWQMLFIFIGFYFLNIIAVVFIFCSNRRENVKLSWIFAIILFPFVGLFAYFFYGRQYMYKNNKIKVRYMKFLKINSIYENPALTKINLEIIKKENPEFYDCFKLGFVISNRSLYKNYDFTILENPQISWINILNDIKKAKKYIFMNFYILGKGEILVNLCDLLKQKVKEGVSVYLIYDHVGSYFYNNDFFIHKLKKAGVKVLRFSRFIIPFVTGKVNYRNHKKDIVIDGIIGYTGGVNISDVFLDLTIKGIILDSYFRFKGQAVKSLQLIFFNDWNIASKNEISYNEFINKNSLVKNNELLESEIASKSVSNNFIQIIEDGPIKNETIHKDLLLKYINSAKKTIWITTPYFMPTNDILNALINAVKLGKDVRIIIPGKTDKLFLLNISKTYCKELLKAGVIVYTLNNSFIHSKMFIFDDVISVVGTTNLDQRSLYIDYQTLVFVYNKGINAKLKKIFLKYIKLSLKLDINEIENFNWFYKFFLNFLQIFIPIL